MALPEGGVPWKEHLFKLEQDKPSAPRLLFVVYEDERHTWRVQTVPKSAAEGFSQRWLLYVPITQMP